jgi:hypothetical protein
MSKSSYSSGKTNGSGLGLLAVITASMIIAAAAGTVTHAAGTVVRIMVDAAAVTLIAMTGFAILVITIRVMMRHRRMTSNRRKTQAHPQQVSRWLGTGVLPERNVSGGRLQLVHPRPEASATPPKSRDSFRRHLHTGRNPREAARSTDESRWS